MNSDNSAGVLGTIYFVVFFGIWAYLIAWAMNTGIFIFVLAALLGGWLVAIFWPLLLLAGIFAVSLF